MKNNNGIFIGILGLILIILSRSGVFKHEVSKTNNGMTVSGFIEENTLITYPILVIGIILLLYGAFQFNKSIKK